MQISRRILSTLFAFELTVAISAYVTIALLLLGDVFLRETGGGSIWGAQRVSVYLMITVGFLGLGLAAAKGRHLRPQFLDGLLPASFTKTANRIGSVLMALIFGSFGVIAIHYLVEAAEYGDLARVIKIPLWYIQLVIPYAFFSTATRYIIFAVHPDLQPQEMLE